MKKTLILFVTCALVLVLGICVFLPKHETKEGYLRIHIRANSDADVDQDVKYIVKEGIVNYLTPKVKDVANVNEAMKIVNENLDEISLVATLILQKNGFNYGAKAVLKDEYFPTRNYGDLILEDGYYDALIVNLGDGAGQNWWCVVYPPLCFVGDGEGDVQYKSLFKEILDKIKNK